jgi:hypothetical protein
MVVNGDSTAASAESARSVQFDASSFDQRPSPTTQTKETQQQQQKQVW